ncbi:hypothetical protein D3C72_1252520 [compost metagenome]
MPGLVRIRHRIGNVQPRAGRAGRAHHMFRDAAEVFQLVQVRPLLVHRRTQGRKHCGHIGRAPVHVVVDAVDRMLLRHLRLHGLQQALPRATRGS